ncbi:MAG: efflux transporter periplasmic adaptor subunit, partial [Mesorhizobium sp.]
VISVPQTAVTSSLYGDFVFVVVPAKSAEGGAAAPAKPDDQKTGGIEKPASDATKPQADASKPASDTAKSADNAAKPADNAQKPEAGQQPALVLSQVFIKLGRRNNGMVEIVEGLKAGDQVVTAGQNRLFNGMSVAVDNTIDPSKSANKQVQQ